MQFDMDVPNIARCGNLLIALYLHPHMNRG
jgi:hypothetical protein